MFQNHARSAVMVVDQQHLRAQRENIFHFADDPIGRNHRHVGLNVVTGALVDSDQSRLLGSAGGDHLGCHSL